MQIISIINQKGGVGKTTTVINLAAGLSQKEKKILVIDLDPQGNATTGLGLSNIENSRDTIYDVLNGTKSIHEVIKKTQFQNLDIVTSRILWLEGLEEGINKGPGVDSKSRFIYIHGTAEEGLIGELASNGCVRMYNSDVIDLYSRVTVNTQVWIF